jgi:transposase
MPKLDYTQLIQESEEELKQQERQQTKSYYKDRVRFIRYLKTGVVSSQIQSGELIGLKGRQSQNLWKIYQSEGLAGLLRERKPTYLGKMSTVEQSRLLQRLDNDDVMTQKQVQAYIQAEMGKRYTQAGIHYLFKRLKVKLKTGRPVNIRKDQVGEAAFKKNAWVK